MAYDPDDKRALFQRIVDDFIDQIEDGQLKAGDRLPSAKEISDGYDVSSMTAQRALREMQALGLTYGMAGKGTFLRPDAKDKIHEDEKLLVPPALYGIYMEFFNEAMQSDEAEKIFEDAVEAGDDKAHTQMMRYARRYASQKTAEHMDAMIEYNRSTPTHAQLSRQQNEAAAAKRATRRRKATE